MNILPFQKKTRKSRLDGISQTFDSLCGNFEFSPLTISPPHSIHIAPISMPRSLAQRRCRRRRLHLCPAPRSSRPPRLALPILLAKSPYVDSRLMFLNSWALGLKKIIRATLIRVSSVSSLQKKYRHDQSMLAPFPIDRKSHAHTGGEGEDEGAAMRRGRRRRALFQSSPFGLSSAARPRRRGPCPSAERRSAPPFTGDRVSYLLGCARCRTDAGGTSPAQPPRRRPTEEEHLGKGFWKRAREGGKGASAMPVGRSPGAAQTQTRKGRGRSVAGAPPVRPSPRRTTKRTPFSGSEP